MIHDCQALPPSGADKCARLYFSSCLDCKVPSCKHASPPRTPDTPLHPTRFLRSPFSQVSPVQSFRTVNKSPLSSEEPRSSTSWVMGGLQTGVEMTGVNRMSVVIELVRVPLGTLDLSKGL